MERPTLQQIREWLVEHSAIAEQVNKMGWAEELYQASVHVKAVIDSSDGP